MHLSSHKSGRPDCQLLGPALAILGLDKQAGNDFPPLFHSTKKETISPITMSICSGTNWVGVKQGKQGKMVGGLEMKI